MKSRDCLESSRLCESTLGDETALEAEATGARLTGETWFTGDLGRRRHPRRTSRKRARRGYSLMEGVPGERRVVLLTEAAGSTPSTSHSSRGAFRAEVRVTGNLRGYVFSSSHGRQRRGGARRKASHLGAESVRALREARGRSWRTPSSVRHSRFGSLGFGRVGSASAVLPRNGWAPVSRPWMRGNPGLGWVSRIERRADARVGSRLQESDKGILSLCREEGLPTSKEKGSHPPRAKRSSR